MATTKRRWTNAPIVYVPTTPNSQAIKRMTALGIRCILVRDLTDAMYNPEDAPRVSHDAGTQLVIEYIEKYWCPTAISSDLLKAFAR